MPDIIQTNFTAGELSPRMRGRIDLNKYYNGLAQLRNGIVLTHGPVTRRNGFRFVGEAKDSTRPVRLLAFEFSDRQVYVLEFGHFYCRFYMNGGLILKNNAPYEIATPYAGIELAEIKYTQSADIIFLFHPDHPIHILQRYAHDYWLIEPLEIRNGPWLPENDTDTTISNSGYVGEISLVANPDDGAELIQNGNFQAQPLAEQLQNPEFDYPDTAWTWGTGWEHDADYRLARAASANQPLAQNITTVAGKVYQVSVHVQEYYGGNLTPRLGNTAGTAINATGVHVQFIKTTNTDGLLLQASSFSGALSMVSVRDVATDTYWTWGSGWEHDIQAQAAKHTSGTEPLSQNLKTIADKSYKVKFRVSSRTAGSVTPYIGTTAGIAVSTNAQSTQIITAPYNGAPLRFVPSADFNGKVSEVSVRLYGAGTRVFYEEHVGSLWKLNHDTGRTIESCATGNPTRFKTTNHHLQEGDVVVLKGFTDRYWTQLNGLEFAVHVIDANWFSIPYDSYEFSTPTTGSWTKKDGGYCRITQVISGQVAKAQVISPFHSTGPTKRWAEGAWSAVRGYPRCGCFFEERLYVAGSMDSPQTIWASAVGDYNNFRLGSQDNDALSFTLSSSTLDVIHWLSAWRVILVGTVGGIWRLMGSTLNDPITPTSISVRKEIAQGSHWLQPMPTSVAVLCADKSCKRIIEIAYQFELDSYVSQDMQVLSEHINLAGIKEFDLQVFPDQILWCVLEDGTLTGMTYQRSHEVVAWHKHVTDGAVESVCVIPGPESDQVWLVVRRTIGGTTKRYIEYFDLDVRPWEDACHLDSWLSYQGAPATTLYGLEHLEGKQVAVWGNGQDLGTYVVNNGSIRLPKAVTKAVVGLPYTFRLVTMPIEYQAQGGSVQGKLKFVPRALLMVDRTKELLVGAHGQDDWQPLRLPEGQLSGTIPVAVPGGFSRYGQLDIKVESPAPATVVGLVMKVTHGEH